MTEKRVQPEWILPSGQSKGVKVNNSLKLGELVDLVPNEGNILRWYTCGPTVYDSAHLGHARNYVTFDIIMRILQDYFGYDIFYCMNITDIDDKIILRARRNYFYEEFVKQNPTLTTEVLDLLKMAWVDEIADLEKKIAKNIQDEKSGNKNKTELLAGRSLLEEKLKKAKTAFSALTPESVGSPALPFLEACADPLAVQLDKEKGATLDPEFLKTLCDQHSKKYEKEFFDDLRKLNVKVPDVLVRVSEYVPEVIEMVQKIMDNGFAYVSEGSVYFDSAKFHNDPQHVYGKLAPWSIGNLELLAEGEGALMTGGGRRKSDKDFALWKASKAGEPSWDSPWGKGRPGWHIECSAMAGKILGSTLDVHCGGADLKFPHHDNEMAQAEAYFGNKQWVNYFLHSGHLDIDGLKMSKSLKNFISIKDTLAMYSPRQIRLLFLLQAWDSKMNYQVKDTMQEVDTKDKAFTEFFLKVNALLQQRDASTSAAENWLNKDVALHEAFLQAEVAVRAALSRNFNTSEALNVLVDLLTKANSYMVGNAHKKPLLLAKISNFILRILNVFGLDYGSSSSSSSSSSSVSAEEFKTVAGPVVDAIAKFRQTIRTAAKEKKEHSVFLQQCDHLRDDVMPEFGVKIVDDADFSFFFVNKEELKAEIAKKRAEAAEGMRQKQIKSLQGKLAATKKDLEKWEKYSVTPQEAVKNRFNVEMNTRDAIPPADLEGKELSGAAKKQIPKIWSQQEENHQKYLQEVEKDPKFLETLKATAVALEEELKKFA